MTDSPANIRLRSSPAFDVLRELADVLAERLGSRRRGDDQLSDPAVTLVSADKSIQKLHGLIGELTSLPGKPFERCVLAFSMDEHPLGIGSTLEKMGLYVHFRGFISPETCHRIAVAVILPVPRPRVELVPSSFRVTAIMTVYNEADILAPSIRNLNRQGVDVFIIDNWSTDGSYEIARKFLGRGVVGLERYPASSPSGTYDWESLLTRVEDVAEQLRTDWVIHHDVDEYRMSPWPGVLLRTALHAVESYGFNAVDHTVLNHHPTSDDFRTGQDFVAAFPYFEFGTRPGHFKQIKAWKHSAGRVRLADSGGHQVKFEDRRVFPFNFLLRHYPVRGQSHGERKVFLERGLRWNESERKRGWHSHYDSIRAGHDFIRRPETLLRFDDPSFFEDFLAERLLRVGLAAS